MRKTLSILFLMLISISFNYAKDTQKVPAALVERLSHYDYKSDPNGIIDSIYKIIFPDSLFKQSDQGVLTVILADLDGDLSLEILALVGLDEYETNIILLKQMGKEWCLVFTKPVDEYYDPPELHVVNNASRNKVFYTRQLYERGTGIFSETYQFFKLIDGRVYQCLEVLNKAHISGWNLPLNQEVSSRIIFLSSNTDEVLVTYIYNFFSSLSLLSNNGIGDEKDDVSFARGEEEVPYRWDSVSYSYKPVFYSDPKSLNQSKIDCFDNFGNDSLFVKAFKPEINEMLQKGTKKEKKLLRDYLDLVKAESNIKKSNAP